MDSKKAGLRMKNVKVKKLHCVNFKTHRSDDKRLLPIFSSLHLDGATRINLILNNSLSSDSQEIKLYLSYNSRYNNSTIEAIKRFISGGKEFKEIVDIIRLRRMKIRKLDN